MILNKDVLVTKREKVTSAVLFEDIVKVMKNIDDCKEFFEILDYALPTTDNRKLSVDEDYEIQANYEPGCEGIYYGFILINGEESYRLGTVKTLNEDTHAQFIMGGAAAIFRCLAEQYVWLNRKKMR